MKRLIAVVLAFVLLVTTIPVTAFAETVAVSAKAETEYIYNSDLFFGYSAYLTETYNKALLSLEQYRMQTTNNVIHQDYINTGHFYTSVVSQGLSIATDPAGTVKYFTDNVGATNFQFNDELDKANVTFVKKLCETNILLGEAGSLIKENNKYVKKMNGFLKAVQSVEKAGLLDEAYYDGLDKAEVYSTMYEQSMAYYKEYFTQINPSQSFNTQLHTALSEMTNALGGITTAADFTYALCLSLLMQDAQIELIQDIIDTQPTTSTLYKGLTRLKNQLKNGWMSYFIDTFVKGKVYEQVVGRVSGKINGWIMGDWTSYYSAVTAVVKVVNTVVFEWILDANYGAYRSALMLDTYASDLCASVKNKALTFQTAGFTAKDIERYELLFNAYIAMSEASLDACQDLAIHNTTYTKTYLDEKLKLYDNDDIYTDYLNDIKNIILSISKENRIITNFGTWALTGDTTLVSGSDIINEDTIYASCNVFVGNIKVNGEAFNPHKLIIPKDADVHIDGDFSVLSSYDTLTVDGRLTINNLYGGTVSSKTRPHIYNNNEIVIKNNAEIKYTDLIQSDNAKLYVAGDYSFISSDNGPEYVNGTIIFNGNQQQVVGGLRAYNVDVQNPKGIKYSSSAHLYGKYSLNGNPLVTEVFTPTFIYDGIEFDGISDYKNLLLGETVYLTSSFKGDLDINGGKYDTHKLIIPKDANVHIDGDLSVLSRYDILTVDGSLTINNLYTSGATSSSQVYSHIYNNNEIVIKNNAEIRNTLFEQSYNAKLCVGGNYSFAISGQYGQEYVNGTIIFNGNQQQVVGGILSNHIVLENTSASGVVFKNAISPTILFNHNGNAFTLYNAGTGSTFVDYDGDGTKDNVDPEPTVGNPCTLCFRSEDTEKGTVSLSEVQTIGGTKITVTATPTFKYDFAKWVNSVGVTASTSAECTLVAKGDDTYTAIFTKRQQPITTQTEGGTINVAAKAEIESDVTVTITENDGYVYTEGSLAYNGIQVENGSFIMPDEAVTLTAEFVRNESYFALSDALTTAKSYTYQSYSKESFVNLTAAITNAKSVLVNNISAEESANQIALLQAAIDGLEEKFISSVTLKTTPTLYINVPDIINDISVLVTYDNGTTITVTGADCTIEGYDASALGQQSITITYGDVFGTAIVTVQKRPLGECAISNIVDMLYDGVKKEYIQVPNIIYNRTGENLTENVDFVVAYSNNTKVGEATAIITGIDNYTGIQRVSFNIYCKHNYSIIAQVDPTCTKTGYQTEKCAVCGKVNSYENIVTEGLPESEHNYANSIDVSYYYTNDGASSLNLKFSSSTLTESTHDKIYIYDENDSLIGTYSGSSLASKSITVSGDTVRIRLKTDGSVVKYGFSLDSITAYFDHLLLPTIEHNYGDWFTVAEATPVATGIKHKLCTECGDEVTGEIPAVEGLAFKGASLTLHHNLAINYKVDEALFDIVGYTNPYVVFEIGGKETTVKAYAVEGDRYVFRFRNIAPNQMNDTIYATLYATYNGVEYASETREYSVAEYCYSTLDKYSADDYAALRTLLVDLLHYGAQSQLYTKYNTENLVNANLTEAQLTWGTSEDPTLTNSLNIAYEMVENPLITWKGASLNLNDSVSMRFKFITEDIDGLSLKITSETDEWNITANNFVLEEGVYSVCFSGLNAGQMSEKVYVTMYKDGVAVSNTVCYSIESYAYNKQDSTVEHLSDLVKAMMKYGNSAYAYVN